MPRGVYDRQPRRRPGRPKRTEEPPQAAQGIREAGTEAVATPGNGCEGCHGAHLHGLNYAEVQVVTALVREGLTLARSAELAQQAQAARG